MSKLSPFLGNLIEINRTEFLNKGGQFSSHGQWERQDPGFPDIILRGGIEPTPGFEIKTWFPLATEITGRFKDSQNHFVHDQTYVALIAWLPEHLLYGKPAILDVCIVPAKSIAAARDSHYHNPPDYLVLEPEDTSTRTRNLRQTNTAGYKWQGTAEQFEQAEQILGRWGADCKMYNPSREYQERLRDLLSRFRYRLDTNFAKIDRIVHGEIEAFKTRVLATVLHGRTIADWTRLLFRGQRGDVTNALSDQLGIKDRDARDILE
jgi:hypothetical protein